MQKKDIKNFTLKELKDTLAKVGEPLYRAEQVFFWLYQRGVLDFKPMRNMPLKLLERLKSHYYISTLTLRDHLRSSEGAEKFLFELSDGKFIESVLIHAKDRKTVCLSTQVGCKFACSFCASGRKGFKRNLTPAEILNQILFLQFRLRHKITNYVFMGMGEPLDNFDYVSKAIKIINEPKGMAIGARRITISTCGLIPGIEKLQELGLQVNLSVSLHAVTNKLRNELVPVNKRYPLEKLIRACEEYVVETGRMLTLEYILIEGKNDSLQDADKLAAIAKKLRAKINLIPYSIIANLNYRPTQQKKADTFIKRLAEKGVSVTIRESKGADIRAACGQLAGKF